MSEIKDLLTVNDYSSKFNLSTLHPLVTVHDLSKGKWVTQENTETVRYHFYGIFLKQGEACIMRYGRQQYDYQEGTLVFVAPGQLVNVRHIKKKFKPSSHALLFHPDLLLGTDLASKMAQYSYFSYSSHEALHISAKERKVVLSLLEKIQFELEQNLDKHSKKLIVTTIALFLDYCMRFYDRQFLTREMENKGSLEKFDRLLNAYFSSDKPLKEGLPSVAYFADALHLSANYFGDLIKKETGISAQEYIQNKVIHLAKNKMYDADKTVSEIAYELGFKYPQHFSRMFKNETGYTPVQFRSLN
ncbi:helix-turn-helix domain-containing protein [Namhaeicola litoreus]|uniref:Helix-turn-helix domain-containing protein n=1 Tax=Namhaeicola litoreus TaxID=1052145 RepID=A0ABW3Y272_9FLAO